MVNFLRNKSMDLRIPSQEEIFESPHRRRFIAGGWVDSAFPNEINVYWHRCQDRFTVHSLLQILEHETLHVILARHFGLETSVKLDNVQHASCISVTGGRLVFANEYVTYKKKR